MSKKKKAAAKARQVKTQDSFQNPLTRSGVFMPNALEATQYPLTRFSRDWQTINSLYRSHWVVRRIIDVIPEDMTKNGYKITTQLDPDAMKKLETTFRRTSTHAKLLKGLKWGRLYGGAGALIMVDGQEDMLDQPLELDQVMPDSYKGLLVLDRWSGITPNEDLVEDPGDPEYGLPKSYTITCDTLDKGIRVHHSRILRFMGRDLPYLEELAENYWGASELEHVIDELRKRDNVSWNIAMLTFMANLRVMKMDGMGMMLGTGNEKAQRDLYNTVQAMNTLMNNNSIQILGENDSYESHQYTFGGIADVYDRFMMDVAGAAETPVTKLFGRSPAGMNATGESDMQNYYDTIEEKQENELRPVYDKLLPIIMMSTFGAVPDDFDYDFNPVRRAPEDEMADLASKNTDSVTKAFQAGLISQRVALKELRQQSELTGMWTNITDEDIEKADDEVMNPDEGMGGDMFGNPEQQPPGTAGGPKGGYGGNDTPNPTKSRQEGREEVTDSLPFTLDGYPKDPDPKNWRTINGSKVHLTKGKIDGGAGGKFTGKAWSGKVAHTSAKGQSKAQSIVNEMDKINGDGNQKNYLVNSVGLGESLAGEIVNLNTQMKIAKFLSGDENKAKELEAKIYQKIESALKQNEAPEPQAQQAQQKEAKFKKVNLAQLSDKELASHISKAMKVKMPEHLNAKDPTQRLVYLAGWNGKPKVVSSQQVEKMAKEKDAIMLYRTLNTNDKQTADQIADSIRTSDVFKTAGNGEHTYGGGMYMADNLGSAKGYGYTPNPNTIGAVLNENAKMVSMDDLKGELGKKWMKEHPAAAKAMGLRIEKNMILYTNPFESWNDQDGYTMMAMMMGYNVVYNKGYGYYNILDREVLTTSQKNYY